MPADGTAGSDAQLGRRRQAQLYACDLFGAALMFWDKGWTGGVAVEEEGEANC